ncbi:MAG: lysylphosphatidylglycerol synthase domain-containing protein [Chloroflexota bacterium]
MSILQRILSLLARLPVLLPLLLTVALGFLIYSIPDLPGLVARIAHLPYHIFGIVFGLALGYLSIKAVQFRWFLAGLQIEVTWPQLIISFAVGEIALAIPAGVYAQNYVLRRVQGSDFALSSAATTAVLIAEGGTALLIAAIIGVQGYSWLRPAVLAILGAVIITIIVFRRLRSAEYAVSEFLRTGPLGRVGIWILEFLTGLGELTSPRVVLVAVLLAAGYLFCIVAGFFMIAISLGLPNFSFPQAISIYTFALAVGLGVAEASGTVAMEQLGYNADEALSILFAFRLVWTACVWLVAGSAIIILRREIMQPRQPPTLDET